MTYTKKNLAIYMAFCLMASGCSITFRHYVENRNSKFKYNELNDETYQAYDEVKYDSAKRWYLVERINELGVNELCVSDKQGMDVLTKEFVGEIVSTDGVVVSADKSILCISSIEPYLESYLPKDLYTPEDIQTLLNMIAADYEWHDEKVFTISEETTSPASIILKLDESSIREA